LTLRLANDINIHTYTSPSTLPVWKNASPGLAVYLLPPPHKRLTAEQFQHQKYFTTKSKQTGGEGGRKWAFFDHCIGKIQSWGEMWMMNVDV
jgi:hypothetical protein